MTDPKAMLELLPCPFCGGDAEMREATTCHDTWFVRCTECQCKTVTSYDKYEPTVTWNARTAAQSAGERTKEVLESAIMRYPYFTEREAAKIAEAVTEKIISDVIRPGFAPEERTCHEITAEIRSIAPELKTLASTVVMPEKRTAAGAGVREAIARKLAAWIHHDWDGLYDHSVVDQNFKEFVHVPHYQGGKPDLLRLADAILAILPSDAMREALEEILNLEMGRGDGVVGDYVNDVRSIASAALVQPQAGEGKER
jgi:hypothetical protein